MWENTVVYFFFFFFALSVSLTLQRFWCTSIEINKAMFSTCFPKHNLHRKMIIYMKMLKNKNNKQQTNKQTKNTCFYLGHWKSLRASKFGDHWSKAGPLKNCAGPPKINVKGPKCPWIFLLITPVLAQMHHLRNTSLYFLHKSNEKVL